MSPVVELLLESSQDSISQIKNLSASEYKQENKEEMQQQKQATSSFNIMSMLNPVPSPSYKSSLSKVSTVGSSVQQETQTHLVLPPASCSNTQQSFYSLGNLPQSPQTSRNLILPPPYPVFQPLSPPPTFSSSANTPINFGYGYAFPKQQSSPFNNVTNVTPLSQANTCSSTSISVTNTPTTIQSSSPSLLLNNNLSLQNTPSTNYNSSPTNVNLPISPTSLSLNGQEKEVIPVDVDGNNYHNLLKNDDSDNNTNTNVGIITVRKNSIPADSNETQLKDLSNNIGEYVTNSVQEVEYLKYSPPHPSTNMEMEMKVEEEIHFVSGLDQLASTALNELQNMKRKEMETSEAGSGHSDQELDSLPASPFVERSFTPIKTFISPPSYESTTGSTPAPLQTDSEFPQYEYDHEAVLFGDTTETDSDGESQVEEAMTTKAAAKHVVKKNKRKKSLKNKGKGKDRQTKNHKYKIKREEHEVISSEDDKPRKRKPTTKRPRSAPLKRKATSQSVLNSSKNSKRLKKSSSPHFRSRTTSNNSSVNNSPRLQPQVETKAVDNGMVNNNYNNLTINKVDQLYCICRSSDGESFMIECDNCDEWYHGACVNISREESHLVDKYYCPNCAELGFKTSWKPEKCKYPPCKKLARFVKTKFCSIKCGLSWNRELLKNEEKLAKMGKLLKQKIKDNKDKKGRAKRNVTNRSGQIEDGEHLKKISRRKNSIKKELEIIDKRNKITVRGSEKSQSDSEQDDSDGSTRVPCELDKQSESDVNTRNGQICGYNIRLDWVDNDVEEKIESVEEICTTPKGKCKKHGSWQKRRSIQIELMKTNKVERLDELTEQQKLIKARMKKRTDMHDAFPNQTIDHSTSRKKSK
uniref:CXXC-type zinc finger protein 1 n=1 Tax=Anthurium amnicola TaxID=1678845 RepID=A0A1D1XXF2_9ARAE